MSIAKISDYPMPQVADFPTNTVDWQLNPKKAALLIHDMQNYFINFYSPNSELITQLINNLFQLRQWANDNKVPVLYTAQPYEQPKKDRALLNDMWGPGLPASTIDQQLIIDRLKPGKDDIVLSKWRYSAFARSNLYELMRNLDREQIIIGGIYAHIGCMITAVDAFMNDIQPFFIGDAVADFSQKEHLLALKYVSGRCGKVQSTKALIESGTLNETNKITQQWVYDKLSKLIEENDENIDPEENLIVYGLDSLSIMQFVSALKKHGVEVSFEEIARNPTLSNWWTLIQERQN